MRYCVSLYIGQDVKFWETKRIDCIEKEFVAFIDSETGRAVRVKGSTIIIEELPEK